MNTSDRDRRGYRRRIVLDHTKVSGEGLNGFPILVALKDAGLRAEAHGGHVAMLDGGDLLFLDSDGRSPLAHELEVYDPIAGALKAWVRIPVLSQTNDTVIYLCYGQAEERMDESGRGVWDAHYSLVSHLGTPDTPGSADVQEDTGALNIADAVTVEAWVHTDTSRAEALQALVSKWSLRASMDAFESFDAGGVDGLNTRGFFGAVFDGRYVYFSPQYNGEERHGNALRYDTHGGFDDPGSWAGYPAGDTSGLTTKGYYGAVFDGHYVYFVPRFDGEHHHSKLLRYDTREDFRCSESWDAFDVGEPVSHQSGAFDGRYIYFAPGYDEGGTDSSSNRTVFVEPRGPSGKVLRYDTQGELTDPESYVTYDAGNTSGLNSKCYDGAVFDGRYVYFAPLDSIGIVLRCDTQGDFTAPESWVAWDASVTSGQAMGQCVGAIFDGRYVYFVPYANSVVVRYDTERVFDDPESWTAYDASDTSGLKTKGYDGAAFDGRYVYFIPFWEGEDPYSGFHARLLRYDTQRPFADPAAWEAADGGRTSPPNPGGFNGGAFDGRYIYFSPWREDGDEGIVPHGKVLRYDTLDPDASFILKYMDCGHNGGLCAAVPGPSFSVNTAEGLRSVWANRNPGPGWHHLAGVYDGEYLTLYIDGVPVNRSECTGPVRTGAQDVVLGRISDGAGRFDGLISDVRISSIARSEGWIRTTYCNLKAPGEFVRAGDEERLP